jgi:hypothetical protein
MNRSNLIKITLMAFALALALGLVATSFGAISTVQAGGVALPNCPAGEYFNSDEPGLGCQTCPAGYYCEGGVTPIAMICPWNVSSLPGSSTIDDCNLDHRLNRGMGDNHAVIYPERDPSGNPELHIYCVWKGLGYQDIMLTADDLLGLPDPKTLSQHLLIKSSEICNVNFYLLTSGWYQINIGPDEGGTVYELLFEDLTGASLIHRTFNVQNLVK